MSQTTRPAPSNPFASTVVSSHSEALPTDGWEIPNEFQLEQYIELLQLPEPGFLTSETAASKLRNLASEGLLAAAFRLCAEAASDPKHHTLTYLNKPGIVILLHLVKLHQQGRQLPTQMPQSLRRYFDNYMILNRITVPDSIRALEEMAFNKKRFHGLPQKSNPFASSYTPTFPETAPRSLVKEIMTEIDLVNQLTEESPKEIEKLSKEAEALVLEQKRCEKKLIELSSEVKKSLINLFDTLSVKLKEAEISAETEIRESKKTSIQLTHFQQEISRVIPFLQK